MPNAISIPNSRHASIQSGTCHSICIYSLPSFFFFLSHVMNWMRHAHSKNEQAPQDQMNDNEMKQ